MAEPSQVEHSFAPTIIGLLVLVSGLIWLARRLSIPYPIFLVLGGLAIALLPLPPVRLASELVFLLFLPPLLYQAGLDTSWRDFRANLGVISMLAFGLVIVTTIAVAVAAHSLLALSWPAAFALGAIVSPPDAIAATSIMQRLRIPKRIVTILEGESLVNDAAALVIFTFAVAAAASPGTFSVASAASRMVIVSAGGVGVGLLVGWVACKLRERLRGDDAFVTLVALLIPYAAYLPAEWIHCSGVLSVVTAGLFVGRRLPRIASSEQRLRERAVWETLILLLNGVVFVLIGLQLPSVVDAIDHDPSLTITRIVAVTAAVAFVVIAIRFIWNEIASRGHRRVVAWRGRGVVATPREVVVMSWAGMRGIVSLATAIALPLDFAGRDPILFVAFGVILVTLVGQGLTLGPLIRRLGLAPDDLDDREQALARRELAYAAVGRLEAMEMIGEASPSTIAEVRAGYDARIRRFTQRIENAGAADPADAGPLVSRTSLVDVELEALDAERAMLIKLRDDDLIADEILRHVQGELDLAELRLRRDQAAH